MCSLAGRVTKDVTPAFWSHLGKISLQLPIRSLLGYAQSQSGAGSLAALFGSPHFP